MSNQHTKAGADGMRQLDLIVHGATGRMGQRIMDLARVAALWRVVATVSRTGLSAAPTDAAPGRSGDAGAGENAQFNGDLPVVADLVIDFSSDAGARCAVELAKRLRCALLTGSTGLTQPTIDALDRLSQDVAVLAAPNTSRGIAIVTRLAAQAAAFDADFDPVIIETHHVAKRDAPSGTAIRLAGAMRAAGANLPESNVVSVRVGHVIGEHIIRLEGPHESVQIIHRAHSRDVFAAGALGAGAWLVEQPPGSYTMEDALGFVQDAH